MFTLAPVKALFLYHPKSSNQPSPHLKCGITITHQNVVFNSLLGIKVWKLSLYMYTLCNLIDRMVLYVHPFIECVYQAALNERTLQGIWFIYNLQWYVFVSSQSAARSYVYNERQLYDWWGRYLHLRVQCARLDLHKLELRLSIFR